MTTKDDFNSTLDVSGERDNYVMKGVQHKYPETVLILTTPNCFKHCSFCLRKRFTFDKKTEEIFDITDLPKLVDYIRDNSQIKNILLTGGDFLFLEDETIEIYLEELVPLVDYIRIGTRALDHNPKRFGSSLINIFKKYKHKLIIQSHFDTADQITDEVISIAYKLHDAGLRLYNQTVILNSINNNEHEMFKIVNRLFEAKITPYYFFQCRPIKDNDKFLTEIDDNCDIFQKVRSQLPGNMKQFKYILTNELGKIEIIGKSFTGEVFIKYNQCTNKDLIDKILTINGDRKWITVGDIEEVLI